VFNAPSVRLRFALAAIAASFVLPSVAAAQNKFSVTPWVGSYFAISKFYDDNLDLTVIGGTGTAAITVSQNNTAMFGLRVSVPIGATLAAEGSFGYAKSDVFFRIANAQPPFDLSDTDKGSVIIGSVRAVIKPRRSNLSIVLGGILVNHGGSFWDDPSFDGKKTSFGGVVGFGLRANVTPRFPIDIRAEANLYSFNPDKGDNASLGFFPGKFQQDLVFSVGIPLGGK
jgi:hypothetical protein